MYTNIMNKINIARRENEYSREYEKEFNKSLYVLEEYSEIPFDDFIEFCYEPYFEKFQDNVFVRINANITNDTDELRKIIVGIKNFAKRKGFMYSESIIKPEKKYIILKFKKGCDTNEKNHFTKNS